ncbi:MAG: energy-coupling factor transporter transmembrane component T family protein [Bacilli bacterium]
MSKISLGRYTPYKSPIHHLDVRIKLFGMILLMVAVFFRFASVEMNFIIYGIITFFVLILMALARIRLFQLFKQLKAIWFMVIFLLIMNLITYRTPDDRILFSFWGMDIYQGPIIQTAYIFVRLVLMLAITMVLTSTTRPLDLTYAFEWYLHPLKWIRFPVHEVAMTISITLRFIPTLLDETGRIMKAQASRGVDFVRGKLKEKIRAIVSLIVPLFVSAFLRSSDLANAMEARGYDPQGKRTRYRILKFRFVDFFALLLVVSFFAGVILCRVYRLDFAPALGEFFQMIGNWFKK